MSEENAAIAHRWFEQVWNLGKAEAIDEMLSQDCIGHGLRDPDGAEVTDIAAFKAFHRAFRSALPDIRIVVEDTVSNGDRVVARCSVTGTHSGDGLGFAATGKRTAITGMSMMRIRDGRIVESWNNFDMLTMFQQLGMAASSG